MVSRVRASVALIASKGWWAGAIVAALILAHYLGPVLYAGSDRAPGAPGNVELAGASGLSSAVDLTVEVDGRRFTVTDVLADGATTAISYNVQGSDQDGLFVTIAPRPRLVLSDGTIVPFQWNATDRERPQAGGTLIFDALPRGKVEARLEVDGLQFQRTALARRIDVPLSVDTAKGYEQTTRQAVHFEAGEERGQVVLDEVVSAPTGIIIRGRFPGMSAADFAAMGTPHYGLVLRDGSAVEALYGRRGFGDSGQQFEFVFVNAGLGSVAALSIDHGAPLVEPGIARIPVALLEFQVD